MTAPAFEEVPMPEAYGYVCDPYDSDGSLVLYEVPQVSALGNIYRNDPLYTADQLRAYGDQRAYAALDKAHYALMKFGRSLKRQNERGAVFLGADVIEALPKGATTARECLWTPDADGYWKTACGQGHTFTTDGPAENNHRFCCYCGGRISMNGSGA